MGKRTLELTHEQIEILEEALGYSQDKALDISKDLFNQEQRKSMLKYGRKFEDLRFDISEGKLDV